MFDAILSIKFAQVRLHYITDIIWFIKGVAFASDFSNFANKIKQLFNGKVNNASDTRKSKLKQQFA